ncbi:MAG TPA: mechanosensitive ion channel domain-containing protein [Thermodesulfovibrionales bacterium]|nr:mechanosensitive ion channel domain-containing protein [Thermodesulfovibrionales bacterium]
MALLVTSFSRSVSRACRGGIRRGIRLFVVLCLLCPAGFLSSQAASAQKFPPIIQEKGTSSAPPLQAALPSTDEDIDETIARLESRIAELRQLSAAASEAVASEAGGVFGATPDEIRNRQRIISETIFLLDRHVKTLRDLRDIRKTNSDHAGEIKAWKGFKEKPPFPISFLDSLRDAILNQRLDLQALEMRLPSAREDLRQFTKNLKESRKELRLAQERFDKSKGTPSELRQRWLLDLIRQKNELNEAGAASAETRRLETEEALAGKKEYIRFLEEQLGAAERVSPFSKADLELKLQELDSQRRPIEKEIIQGLRRDDDAKKNLQQTRDALNKALAELKPDLPPSQKQIDLLSRLQSLLSAQQVVTETANAKVEILKFMLQLVDTAQTMWEDRYWLTRNDDLMKIREKSAEMRRILENARTWKDYIQSRLLNWTTLIQNQKERIARAERTPDERKTESIILGAYEERQAIVLRAAEMVARVERLANLLNDELTERQEHAPVAGRMREALTICLSFIKKIWNTELYVAEETIIAEGTKIAKPISVTIGKVMQALLILIAGTWLARHLNRPIQWLVIKTFKKDEDVAQQVSKVSFLVLFVCVLVFSLVSVNIPLAVFAFLGGALAIGIGFGAQHLINNFISGLILLFDRSIKVGDIVEIEGQGGRVTSIGMRNSHIIGFDGVELLVPNSQFLQQKVTNWTLSDRLRRYSLSVGVAYGTPTKEVSRLILRAVENHESVLKDPLPVVLLEKFEENALTFSVYFWLYLEPGQDNRIVLSDIRHRIIELLNDAKITIAFPQRDVHLDSVRPLEVKVVPAADSKKSPGE